MGQVAQAEPVGVESISKPDSSNGICAGVRCVWHTSRWVWSAGYRGGQREDSRHVEPRFGRSPSAGGQGRSSDFA